MQGALMLGTSGLPGDDYPSAAAATDKAMHPKIAGGNN